MEEYFSLNEKIDVRNYLEIALFELLQELFKAKEDDIKGSTLLELLPDIFDALKKSLLNQINNPQIRNLGLVNHIGILSLEAIKWALRNETCKKPLLELLKQRKVINLGFFLTLMAHNLNWDLSEGKHCKLKLPENLPITESKGEFLNSSTLNFSTNSERKEELAKIIADSSVSKNSLSSLYQAILQTHFEKIINLAHWIKAQHSKEYNALCEELLVFLRECFSVRETDILFTSKPGYHDKFLSIFKGDKFFDLFTYLNDLLSKLHSIHQSKEIIQYMEKVALSREKGDRKEFWKHFTKTNEKNLIHRLASIEAVLDILGQEASQGKPRPEQLIDKNAMNIAFFLDTLKYSLENVDAIFQKETESEYVARRLQKIILFISSFHSKKFFIFLSSFMKVFKKIIDSPNFHLSYLIFEKFSFNPFQPLMFEFIPIYYESIFSKSDDPVHFKKYKEVFAKIFECIHTRGIELTGSRNQNFEELRNIWIFWSRILIKLLSKEEIKDFQSLYNSLCFSDFPFKYSKIFHSRRNKVAQQELAKTVTFQKCLAFLKNPLIQSKKILFYFICLTISLLEENRPASEHFFSRGDDKELFQLLCQMERRFHFGHIEWVNIISGLFQVCASCDFFKIISEKVVNCDQSQKILELNKIEEFKKLGVYSPNSDKTPSASSEDFIRDYS